jgi:glycine betaine/proline transport system substrate-binding protein
VRKNFYQDFPVEVTEFLSRMFIPLPELEQIMARATESSYDEAVKEYIAQHPARVNYWVTGQLDKAP